MEEHKSSSSPVESAAALSASALRELQQRARAAMADSREKAAQLEADLTRQLDDIAATLNERMTLEPQSSSETVSLHAEIDRLTKELDDSRSAWLAEQSDLESQRDELVQKVIELENALEVQHGELTENTSRFEDSRVTWESERTQLESQRDILVQRVSEFESILESLRSQASGKEIELTNLQESWSTERAQLESQRDELTKKLTDLEKCLESQRNELARSTSAFDESRTAWTKERSSLESHRDQLLQKMTELDSVLASSQAEWRDQLLDFENRLREQQNSWDEQRADWSGKRAALERERGELQQKFDLALQDVQRLRARVAELEQDLSRRPEPDRTDSAELVALRAERDALSARVEQLEQRPTTQIDPNVEQHLSDLQRRFELAVEDVRELKTKNARLESQLAAAAKKSQPPADSGGMDWESQKRRLLAALEDGSNTDDTPAQKKERFSIESTIEMTDTIVAEKDRQIAELQAQLAAGIEGAACQIEQDPKVKELLDTDEVIAEHRKRVAELEREMEQKLRTAELELSVERAKIARQKMELEELRSDLESQRQAIEATGVAPVQGQPRRRWLSKLGLTGDE